MICDWVRRAAATTTSKSKTRMSISNQSTPYSCELRTNFTIKVYILVPIPTVTNKPCLASGKRKQASKPVKPFQRFCIIVPLAATKKSACRPESPELKFPLRQIEFLKRIRKVRVRRLICFVSCARICHAMLCQVRTAV